MAKRYRVRAVKGQVTVDEQGPWVDYNDYDALAARLAEVTKDRDAYFADLLDKNSRLAEAERLLREIADDQDDRVSPGLRIAAQQFLAAVSARCRNEREL